MFALLCFGCSLSCWPAGAGARACLAFVLVWVRRDGRGGGSRVGFGVGRIVGLDVGLVVGLVVALVVAIAGLCDGSIIVALLAQLSPGLAARLVLYEEKPVNLTKQDKTNRPE